MYNPPSLENNYTDDNLSFLALPKYPKVFKIHLLHFNSYLLSSYYLPVHQKHKNPCPPEAHILG